MGMWLECSRLSLNEMVGYDWATRFTAEQRIMVAKGVYTRAGARRRLRGYLWNGVSMSTLGFLRLWSETYIARMPRVVEGDTGIFLNCGTAFGEFSGLGAGEVREFTRGDIMHFLVWLSSQSADVLETGLYGSDILIVCKYMGIERMPW
jgi:hypothetical protein